MNDEFLCLGDAAQLVKTSRTLLFRRIRSGELPTFEDPLDKRRTLVRKSDLEPMQRVRPARRPALTDVSAA